MAASPTSWEAALYQLKQKAEPYVLVTVVGVQGSTPRETGSKMLVTADKAFDSIGGGNLEFKAIEKAREMLDSLDSDKLCVEHFSLSASLGQCCGGAVSVLFERFQPQVPRLTLFGAGHVSRALVTILSQLPCQVDWVDSRAAEFPASVADNIHIKLTDEPVDEMLDARAGQYLLIMTHNHQLDLALVEAALKKDDFAYLGVIGSAAKALRFRNQLMRKDFTQAQIESMHCPVGLPQVQGKKPMEVAVSVAGELIGLWQSANQEQQDKGLSRKDLYTMNFELHVGGK